MKNISFLKLFLNVEEKIEFVKIMYQIKAYFRTFVKSV